MQVTLFTVASLALFFGDFRWWAPAVLAMGLLTFWRDGERLWHRVWLDREMARVRREASAGLHFDADARTAWRTFR